METKPKPILCGSGERYFLCFRRRRKRSERAITDIQITFKSTIPMGYQPLNYLHDGTELPYFQRNEDSEQKAQSESNNKSSNSSGSKPTDALNGPSVVKQKSNGPNEPKAQPLIQSASSNPKLQALSSGSSVASSNLKNGAKGQGVDDAVAGNSGVDGQGDLQLTFDNIPLIIFSKNGESNIIDIQFKELGTKLREGLIHVDRSLDDNVANLNKGSEDANVAPIYLSYANDLIAYRFSPDDLNRQYVVYMVIYMEYVVFHCVCGNM